MEEVDLKKPVQTRGGWKVELWDKRQSFDYGKPVIGIVHHPFFESKQTRPVMHTWYEDGDHNFGDETDMDLVNIPQPSPTGDRDE